MAQQFPGDHSGPADWLDLLSGVLDTADNYLTESIKPGVPTQDALGLVRDAAQLAAEVYHYLVLFQGAGMADLPYAVVPPLQRWFDQLKVKNSTFFRAELVANYELRAIVRKRFERIRQPAPTLVEAMDNKVRWPFLRVTVPSKAFAIIPHLAIAAHEIGHALYPNLTWDLTAFQPEYAATQQRIAARLKQGALDARTTQFMKNVFGDWFEELCADAFAFYLTGPAMFFSLPEFSQFFGPGYGLSHTHPADDLRRQILFDQLHIGGQNSFAEIFRRHTGETLAVDFNSTLLEQTPQKDQIEADCRAKDYSVEASAVLAELHEAMPKVVDIVYRGVLNYLTANSAEAIYTPEKYDSDLATHLGPMLAAIPPIEAGAPDVAAPTEFASILNVGWAALLTKLDSLRVKVTGSDEFRAQRLERLHSLLLKAVELSEARRMWKAAI